MKVCFVFFKIIFSRQEENIYRLLEDGFIAVSIGPLNPSPYTFPSCRLHWLLFCLYGFKLYPTNGRPGKRLGKQKRARSLDLYLVRDSGRLLHSWYPRLLSIRALPQFSQESGYRFFTSSSGLSCIYGSPLLVSLGYVTWCFLLPCHCL